MLFHFCAGKRSPTTQNGTHTSEEASSEIDRCPSLIYRVFSVKHSTALTANCSADWRSTSCSGSVIGICRSLNTAADADMASKDLIVPSSVQHQWIRSLTMVQSAATRKMGGPPDASPDTLLPWRRRFHISNTSFMYEFSCSVALARRCGSHCVVVTSSIARNETRLAGGDAETSVASIAGLQNLRPQSMSIESKSWHARKPRVRRN